MSPRSLGSLATAVLGVLLAGLLCGCQPQSTTALPGGPRSGGPMQDALPHGALVRGEVGARITDGFEVLQLGGDRAATIVSVRTLGGDESLRYLGALLAGPERKATWSQLEGYPPTQRGLGELIPAEGATIEPADQAREGRGYELLLGYEITDDTQLAERHRVEVVYRIGDTDYLWQSPAQLVYCPEQMSSQTCFDQAGDP